VGQVDGALSDVFFVDGLVIDEQRDATAQRMAHAHAGLIAIGKHFVVVRLENDDRARRRDHGWR
jgi:hypothetical protein